MTARHSRKKGHVIWLLVVLLFLAAGGAVYFYLDREVKSNEIAAIDSAEFYGMTMQKGAQPEPKGYPLAAETGEQLSDRVYNTPMGFSIVSNSEKWTGEKLVDIYNELLNNKHDDEVMYVGEVEIFPGASDMDSENTVVAGTQTSKQENYPVFFNMPGLVPDSLKYTIDPKVSIIKLFNMDKYSSAAEAARTIAHEYGHHYTMFYFLQNNEAALNSEYYKLRNLGNVGHDVIFENWDSYMENYDWDIYEIAAEDYVQLMGSPNARVIEHYKDVNDILETGKDGYKVAADDRTVNLFPQKNIFIPLADDVAGLRDYFYSFIGLENDLPELQPADFNLRMSRHTKNGYTYYNITWTKTSVDKDALYTLVCYDSKGNVFWPVKTVYGDEEPLATVGTASTIRGDYIYSMSDDVPKEDRIFKLYLLLPDGRMQASEPFNAGF
ncbi:MAG: hypothetical protein ACM3S4_01175 [Burkholderiales bacterium]